jgi:gluconokinase
VKVATAEADQGGLRRPEPVPGQHHVAKQVLAGTTDEATLAWCFEHGRRPSEEEIEIWNEFMTKRGWRDSSSAALAEAKRLRGLAHREDIQTAFEFHRADESSDETPAS